MVSNVALYAVNLRILLLKYVKSVVPTLQLWGGIIHHYHYLVTPCLSYGKQFFDFVISR